MPFWMATLNPAGKKGRKAKVRAHRTHRRARKLTAWQAAVRKYGGVQEALKHRREVGTRRVSHRGLRRKGTMLRRNSMARRKRGSRKVKRRNPLWRLARGFARRMKGRKRVGGQFYGRHVRRAHRMRKIAGGVGWKQNPRRRARRARQNAVVPVMWNSRRRSSRSYRWNSVMPFQINPGAAIASIQRRAMSFVDVQFWLQDALPLAGGFVASKTVGAMLYGVIGKAVALPAIADKAVRIASDALAATGLAYAAGMVAGRRVADNVFLGGVAGVAHSVLREILGGTAIGSAIGLSGLGDDLAERMKYEVQRRVEAEMSGMGAFLTQTDLNLQGLGAYLNQTDLQSQMLGANLINSPGYSALPNGSLADYGTANESIGV